MFAYTYVGAGGHIPHFTKRSSGSATLCPLEQVILPPHAHTPTRIHAYYTVSVYACAMYMCPHAYFQQVIFPPHTHTRTRTHAHAHAHTHTHTRTRMHVHAHAYTHTHTRTRIHPHAYTHTHTRTRIHAHANTHTHTRTRIHPHAYTHTRFTPFTRGSEGRGAQGQ